MPKPTIASIRGTVSAAARAEFDEIWRHKLETKEWPTNRWIYRRLTKPVFDEMLKPLNGSYIQENQSSNQAKTYELQPLGVLCTSKGDHHLDLLHRYLLHVRHVFFNLDQQMNIRRDELIADAKFTPEDATELGRLLYFSNIFYAGPGHAPDFSTWEGRLPSDLDDILPNHGSIDKAFETLLLRHWHPNTPISYFERVQRQQFGAPSLNEIFGFEDGGPSASPKKKVAVRKRTPIPSGVETEVILASRRRCAFCFGIDGILDEKKGQVAHIDGNAKNAKESNLVWLCLDHHAAYDGKTSQNKNYTSGELRAYRAELAQALKRKEHVSRPKVVPVVAVSAPAIPPSPYERLIQDSPKDAVEAAWKDVERAAIGVLETKMSFPDKSAAIPIGALVTMLRSFGGVDQLNATAVGQLSSIRDAISGGAPVDQANARAYCSAAEPVITYLRTK